MGQKHGNKGYFLPIHHALANWRISLAIRNKLYLVPTNQNDTCVRWAPLNRVPRNPPTTHNYGSLKELQSDLDLWLNEYNDQLGHTGKYP